MLTAKQEKFIAEFAKCGNQSEAYRRAYNAKNMKPESIWSKASVLMADVKVSARVAEIRTKLEEKTNYTVEQHMKRLDDLSVKAEDLGQISASVKAEELRGKVSGFYVERVEHSGDLGPVVITFAIDRPHGADAEAV